MSDELNEMMDAVTVEDVLQLQPEPNIEIEMLESQPSTSSSSKSDETSCITIVKENITPETGSEANSGEVGKFSPLESWKNTETGGTFQAGLLNLNNPTNPQSKEKSQLLLMKMDSKFMSADEANIIRRRLLFDEDGSDRKVTNLIQLFCKITGEIEEAQNKEDLQQNYQIFKEIIAQCNSLRFLAKKNVSAIHTHVKAARYWQEMHERIRKEIDDLRPLVLAQKGAMKESKRYQQLFEEKNELMKNLANIRAKEDLQQEIDKLKGELETLKDREEELESLVKVRKMYVEGLFTLVKDLDTPEPETLFETVAEIEKLKEKEDVASLLD